MTWQIGVRCLLAGAGFLLAFWVHPFAAKRAREAGLPNAEKLAAIFWPLGLVLIKANDYMSSQTGGPAFDAVDTAFVASLLIWVGWLVVWFIYKTCHPALRNPPPTDAEGPRAT